MGMRDNTIVVGLGNCGCKFAKLLAEKGYNAIFANGSEQDLKLLANMKNVYKLKNFDGFGGIRDRAIDCLNENNEFLDALQKIEEKIIFVAFGAGGSTGSGLSSIVEELLLEKEDNDGKSCKIVCPINVLPKKTEAICKHINAYNAIMEQQDVINLGASFFINNDSFENLTYINTVFTKLLDAFLSDNAFAELNNFDSSEKTEMLKDSGAMILSSAGIAGKDKNQLLNRLVQNGIFAPIQNDNICGKIGIIHKYENDIKVEQVVAEVGKPLNIYEGYNGKNTLVSVSGLTYPISHVMKLGELARAGQQERERNIQAAQNTKLSDLDFLPTAKKETDKIPIKKKSKLDLLRELKGNSK